MSTPRIQPALIIGTGGSGIEVLRRFKRRFREVYPETPYVQLLGIDTAPQESLGREAPELDRDEFLYASDFRMDFYVGPNYLSRHPEIRDWWRGYDRLPLKQVKSGAGQKRPVGRLALFVHYDAVVQRIRAQVQKLFRAEVFDGLPDHYRKSVNLYILSSTCGGTGTGQFIDLAYIARHTIQGVRPGINVNARGLFFLPSVFLETQTVPPQNGGRLRANAFGALTELDYVMHRGTTPKDLRLPNKEVIQRADDPPFRSVYLVGNQTASGKLLTSFHEIMERSAVHVFVELASRLTDQGDAKMDNVLSTVAGKGLVQGRQRAYSAFGEEWLELPSARLRVRWQKRLALQIIDRLVPEQREGSDQDPMGAGQHRLDRSEAFGKLEELWAAKGLSQFMPKVSLEINTLTDVGTEGRDPSVILANAKALQEGAERKIQAVASELRETIRIHAEKVPGELRRSVEDALREGSFPQLLGLLASTEESIRRWITRARQESTRSETGAWLRDLDRDLRAIKPGLFTGKRGLADAQGRAVLSAVEQAHEEWRQDLKGEVGRASEEALPSLLHHVRETRTHFERISDYLTAARALIRQEPEPSPPEGLSVSTMDDEEIERAFHESERPERLEKEAARILKSLVELNPVSVESVTQAFLAASGAAVRELAPEYLRGRMIPSEEIARRLKELQPFAVYDPSWLAIPASKDVQRLRILGIPESSLERKDEIFSSLPVEIRNETDDTVHGDEGRVVMTVQDHGFPLFALDESARLKRDYESLEPHERSLCFIEPDDSFRTWSYLPETTQESKELFGLAFVLGMIRQAGRKLVFNSGSAQEVDVEFEEAADPDGRIQNAADGFLEGGYASTVRHRRRQLENQDTPGLYERCSAWIDEQRKKQATEGFPESLKEYVDLVEAYAKSIRPT